MITATAVIHFLDFGFIVSGFLALRIIALLPGCGGRLEKDS
jgi:hypothetical protein